MTSATQHVPDFSTGFAVERTQRLLPLCLEIAALILLLLNTPTALQQAAELSIWWTVFALAAAGLPALTVITVYARGSLRALRMVCGVQAVAMLAAYASVPLALGGGRMPSSLGAPWLSELAVVAVGAATVAWRASGAAAYAVAVNAALFAQAIWFAGAPLPNRALGDASRQLFATFFFLCLGVAVRHAGALLDATVRTVVAEARLAAEAEARRIARQNVSMLIHDSVIVALLGYATTGASPRAAREARAALDAIDALERGELRRGDRSPEQFAWELQALTTQLDPEASFDYRAEGELAVPEAVADALVEAASEALRNSIRHGAVPGAVGSTVNRQVRVTAGDAAVEIIVLDDGRGFDTSAVSAARLGVRHGIVDRVAAVPGGQAQLSSRVGYGTTVQLRWDRP